MANPYFQFKRFTVWHDKCAMKVGTDGALLGAWAQADSLKHVLDIGTGTGLIALMLAQRGADRIDAIDIDMDACLQARDNIARSPFADRIQVHHAALDSFEPAEGMAYDLIVSNPPYFADSLRCPDDKRRMARHTDTLTLPDLLHVSRGWLAPQGRIALVLPFDQRDRLVNAAREEGLYPARETHVSSVAGAKPKRLLMELSADPAGDVPASHLVIEMERGRYSAEFTRLMRDFYLKI